MHPFIARATQSTRLTLPALTRHFNHIQNTPLVIRARSTLAHGFEEVKVDVDNVPVVEVKQAERVKKPAAAAAAAAAAVGGGEGKEQEVKEGKKEVKGPIAATTDEPAPTTTKEGSKKEKKPKSAPGEPKEPGVKKEKKPATPATAPVTNEPPAPWMIELKVGKIVDVSVHPDADGLYVEKIDVGEEEPRTVVSGLVKYVPIEQMRGKTLITVANLKPASMRGIKSFAMVLCATSSAGKDEGGVEFVEPPSGSLPGDRVYFEGFEEKTALEVLNPKKKIFESVQPGFTTLEGREAVWKSEEGKVHKIVTAKGVCRSQSFVGASLS